MTRRSQTTSTKSTEKNGKPGTPGEQETGTPSPTAGKAIWSGIISIGLVNVPVRLVTMVRDMSFSFRLLHKKDGQPLKYERVCTKDDQVIPWADTVKGYEVRKGEFVVLEKEELKAILPESDRKIRIDKFIHSLSLDPVYFDTPYLLLPDGSGEAYNLLYLSFQKLGMAGVGRVTLRTKEYPVVIRVYKEALILTTLRYTNEVTPPSRFAEMLLMKEPGENELDLAIKIINELSGDLDLTEYHDRFRERVEELIAKKRKGETITVAPPEKEEAKELMAALAETLDQLGKK